MAETNNVLKSRSNYLVRLDFNIDGFDDNIVAPHHSTALIHDFGEIFLLFILPFFLNSFVHPISTVNQFCSFATQNLYKFRIKLYSPSEALNSAQIISFSPQNFIQFQFNNF